MKYFSIIFLLIHLLVVTAEESIPSRELLELLASEKLAAQNEAQGSILSGELLADQKKFADEIAVKKQLIERELETFAKSTRILVDNNDILAANQLGDALIRGWHLDVYMTNKKLFVLLREFSNIKDEITKGELLRLVIRGILDKPELAPIPSQILATNWLTTNLDNFPVKGLGKLREESNKIFIQCVIQWAAKILTDDQIPKSVTSNLFPGGDYPAGVSPGDIKEPDIRADYERRIAEENKKNLIQKNQWQIQHAAKLYFPGIFLYINELNKDILEFVFSFSL